MSDLSAADYGLVVDLASRLTQSATLEAFVDTLLPAVLTLVPGELAGWNEIDLVGGRVDGRAYPPEGAEALFALVARQRESHPLIAYYARTGASHAARISDVCSAEEWQATGLYRDVFGPLGLPHQIGVPLLATPSTLSACAISRGGDDFSRRDCELLDTLRALLLGTERTLRWQDSLESELRELAPTRSRALVASDGTVVAGDPDVAGLGRLPVSEPGRSRASGGRFRIVRVGRTVGAGASRLSSRQLAALEAVADGSTIQAAAKQLGISPRTLGKHLERVYAKLKVNGRVAALAKARDEGLLDTHRR